ncbi:MAG: MBL fold metallo-hydrolase [Pseudomonadota bacterium]
MTASHKLSRRAALAGAAALPLVAAAGATRAGAPLSSGPETPPFQRIKIGNFDVTTLLAGATTREDPQQMFATNIDKETFDAASAANNIPNNVVHLTFTPTIVNTGSELVLFDTGLSAAGTTAALAAAGYTPDQVDVVAITHMHGDHIGGMTQEDGSPTFGNARYVTARKEYDAWAAQDNDAFKAKVAPFAEKMTFIEDGDSLAPGLTAMAAFGHTPGHMNFLVEDGGKQIYLAADFANHFVWSLANPDWHFGFDMDKPAAAATRRRVLDMLSADKIAFVGYHMPWPGIGYVEARDGSFVYVPHSYQLML